MERTDGVPLFIEEMTKAVLEAGGQEDAERAATSIPAPSLAVPASLHASLMARLDRLGSAKEVAQIGAVIGREFSHALLAAVARKEEAALQAALDSLTGAGLLFRQGTHRKRLTCSNMPWCRIGLQHPSSRTPTWVARPHCGSPGNTIPGNRREPAGAAGTSLYRSRYNRKGCWFLGEGRTAIARAISFARSRGAAQASDFADCHPTQHPQFAPPRDHVSGCVQTRTGTPQGLCSAGNQSSSGANASID